MRALSSIAASVLLQVHLLAYGAPVCWKVSGLAGQSAIVGDGLSLSGDKIRDQVFSVRLAGSSSSITPSNGMKCTQISSRSMLCEAYGSDAATIELWAVEPRLKKAYYTKFRSGYGAVDGGAMLVGDVVGTCEN